VFSILIILLKLVITRESMDKERLKVAVNGFLQQFPSVDYVKENMEKLAHILIREEAANTPGHWYHPTRHYFEGIGKGKWYDDILPVLMHEARWFGSIEESREFSLQIRKKVSQIRYKKAAETRCIKQDVIVQEFLKDFPSLEYLKTNLDKVNTRRLSAIARGKKDHWYNVGRSRFKTERGTTGRCYDELLPKLMFLSGWFASLEDAKRYALEIKRYNKKKGGEKAARSKGILTEAEIIAGFKREFPSLEYAKKNMHLLIQKALSDKYLGGKNSWYYASYSKFKKRNEKHGKWYEEVLPGLMHGAEWFDSLEKAMEFSNEIVLLGRRLKHAKALKTKDENEEFKDKIARGLEEKRKERIKEIVAKFLVDFPSLEYAKNNVERLICTALYRAAKGNKRHWFTLARANFKQENGNNGRVYEEVIPNLAYEAGFYESVEAAKELGELARSHVKEKIEGSHERKKEQRKKVVIAQFKEYCPSLKHAQSNMSILTQIHVQRIAGGNIGHWYFKTKNIFTQPDGIQGRWYAEILPNLVLAAGWFRTMDEAKKFVAKVEEFGRGLARENISKARLGMENISKARLGMEKKPPKKRTKRQIKEEREYAIVVERLRREAKSGVSYDGIGNLVRLHEVEEADEIREGMPRAVISSHITSRDIHRMRLSARKRKGAAAQFKAALPFLTPYLSARLLMLHVFGLIKKGKLVELREGISLMSGPGILHRALVDLQKELAYQRIEKPSVIDVESNEELIGQSENPQRLIAQPPAVPLKAESKDFVECSSLNEFRGKKNQGKIKDVIFESWRALKEQGVLILSSTSRMFGPQFSEGLMKLGFDIVEEANTRLRINKEAQERIKYNMGDMILAKVKGALHNTYFLIAKKSSRAHEQVSTDLFEFTRIQRELPEEARSISSLSREFDRDWNTTHLRVTMNIMAMAGFLNGLAPCTHSRHARLIQSVISKYMLEKPIIKPKINEVEDNAVRVATIAEHILAKGEKDRYFLTLREMSRTHLTRLRQARRNGNGGRIRQAGT
jgi:hypothetical protein